MKSNISEIFKNIKEMEPSQKLESLILSEIASIKEKRVKRKLWLVSFSLATSAALAIYAILVIGSEILKSDFWNMINLVFSDMWVVAQNWKEFIFSLLENLPVASIIIIVAPIFIFLWSLKAYQELNKKINLRAHFNTKMFA